MKFVKTKSKSFAGADKVIYTNKGAKMKLPSLTRKTSLSRISAPNFNYLEVRRQELFAKCSNFKETLESIHDNKFSGKFAFGIGQGR